MARSLIIRRDVQKSLAYGWERAAYPGYLTERRLGTMAANYLVLQVHRDVIAAGGFALPSPVIKFTKRTQVGCARWGFLNFSPRQLTTDVVLHEIAHSLTFSSPMLHGAHERLRAAGYDKAKLSPLDRHALLWFCNQGHGPRWVACFIALQERYNGRSAEAALEAAAHFTYEAWGPKRIFDVTISENGRKTWRWERKRVQKTGRLTVSREALQYWRALLANIQH